jgi:hypothetical protein
LTGHDVAAPSFFVWGAKSGDYEPEKDKVNVILIKSQFQERKGFEMGKTIKFVGIGIIVILFLLGGINSLVRVSTGQGQTQGIIIYWLGGK